MMKPSSRRDRVHSLILASVLFGLAVVTSAIPVVHEFQLRLADTYFRSSPPVLQPSPVVLVLIDDASLRRYGRWPWSRASVAELVRRLDAAGARIIGLDILFAEPESQIADGQLADAMHRSRRVVLADKIGTYADGPRWIEPIPALAAAAAGIGHSQAVLDGDGHCRQFPLRELTLDGSRLAFGLEVARQIDPVRTQQFLASYGINDLDNASPVISAAPVLAPIAFRRETFQSVSAADVLQGRDLSFVHGRPVLVGFGPTEIADRLSTPLTAALPAAGVEVHAQILDSVLTGRSLRRLPPSLSVLLVFATCFGSVMAYRNRRGWTMVLTVTGLAGISYFVGWVIFVLQARIPPIGEMLLAVVLGLAAVYISDFVAIERRVRQQLDELRQWLVQHRRSDLVEDPDDITRNLDLLHELQMQLGSLYELHERLLEASHDAIAIFDAAGGLILQNRNFARIFHSHVHVTNQNDLSGSFDWTDTDPDSGEREAYVCGELFSFRQAPLPPTAIAPKGGAIWLLSSLQAREERDRSRAEVLGFITHELRTPLTAIQGFSELMMKFPGSPHGARAPETIYRESKRLLALIHSYLDVLRLDAGARDPALEQVDVADVVHHVFELLTPIAAASGTKLVWLGDRAAVPADKALLHGAILNVVSNAIKYGDKGKEITVRCLRERDDLSIEVHNFGCPIHKADVPNLFSSYYRGVSAQERASGWGLGLAFVKRIAEKHSGRVSVKRSEDGTTFCIHLPVTIPTTAARLVG